MYSVVVNVKSSFLSCRALAFAQTQYSESSHRLIWHGLAHIGYFPLIRFHKFSPTMHDTVSHSRKRRYTLHL